MSGSIRPVQLAREERKDNVFIQNERGAYGFSRASSLLQGVSEWAGVDVDPSYSKLHHLAPLPTVASESAGLCAWMGVSKVARSLTTQ